MKNKQKLRQLIIVGILATILLSSMDITPIITYAKNYDFEKITFTLNSSIVDNNTIDLYSWNSEYYISIDDLCVLTRCSQSCDGNIISVVQGFWQTKFDVKKQMFDDGYQSINIKILEISVGKYAVPALLFLNYFKSIAFFENDTLYCRMPEYTAWEAMNVDYSNSLVDIYDLYGGENKIRLSLAMDIIMDIIMGNTIDNVKYMKDAYNEALNIDMYSYKAIQYYVENNTESLYNDLMSEKTTEFLSVISSKIEYVDSAQTSLEIPKTALELYIDFVTKNQISEFYNLALDTLDTGNLTAVGSYADQIALVWKDGEVKKILLENKVKAVEGTLFLMSSAMEAAQQVKYANQANNLVYRVMGEDNVKKLNLDTNSDEWFKVANVYKSTETALQDSFETFLGELQGEAINELISEAANGIGIKGIAGVKTGVWEMGLETGRIVVDFFSWVDSLASDTWFDYVWTDVGAYEADRLALYLANLQQKVYWITYTELDRLSTNLSDSNVYSEYIYAQQLYCRTSIAMYENLIVMMDEFGENQEYWINLFQNRIDNLVVSLYQLTSVQDDGINTCLPLDLSTYDYSSSNSKENVLNIGSMDNKLNEASNTLKEMLIDNVDEPILNFICDDFDFDGKYEAIAFCGEYNNEISCYFGTLYLVTDKQVKVVREKDGYYDNGTMYDFGEAKMISITQYYASHGLTYYYQIYGDEVVEVKGSGYGSGLYQDEQGRLLMTDSQYDGSVDGSGHTYNVYYFYWNNGLREYGGVKISVDYFKQYDGAEIIIEQINKDGFEIETIYLRQNGIININCCDGYTNKNVRIFLDNESVRVLPVTEGNYYEDGIIKSSLIPEIATYVE